LITLSRFEGTFELEVLDNDIKNYVMS